MTGERWRLVTQQDKGDEHISCVVMSREEAYEQLEYERAIHDRFDWTITEGEGRDCFYAKSPLGVVRKVSVRKFSALADVMS